MRLVPTHRAKSRYCTLAESCKRRGLLDMFCIISEPHLLRRLVSPTPFTHGVDAVRAVIARWVLRTCVSNLTLAILETARTSWADTRRMSSSPTTSSASTRQASPTASLRRTCALASLLTLRSRRSALPPMVRRMFLSSDLVVLACRAFR